MKMIQRSGGSFKGRISHDEAGTSRDSGAQIFIMTMSLRLHLGADTAFWAVILAGVGYVVSAGGGNRTECGCGVALKVSWLRGF
jgi:hypothetical protein